MGISDSLRRRAMTGLLSVVMVCLSCAVVTHAVPANPTTFTLSQANGTTFQARTRGDEWRSWTETTSGYTVLFDEKAGSWVYARSGPEGRLAPGALAVGGGLPVGVPRHLAPTDTQPPLGSPNNRMPGVVPTPPVTGTQKVLVLLVQFTDRSLATTALYWNDKFFGTTNSLHDYYDQVSYGGIVLSPAAETQETTNDGIVIVTLPYAHPNTDMTDANRLIVRNAIIAADPYVNYASFDTNADGYLSTDELHIMTVVAGYERSYGGIASCTPAVWAHCWSLYGTVPAPTVDGVIVGFWSGGPLGSAGGYSQVGEWHCVTWNTPGHPATIGPAAHELGHDLGTGAPDLYDTDNSSEGVGEWCLMGSASWNGLSYSGDCPGHPSAWIKWWLGFLTPTQVTAPAAAVSIPRVEDAGGASHGVYQLLDNPGGVDWDWSPGTGEYFLVENRQPLGYDVALPGFGLLIWHIYEAAPGDGANEDEGTSPPGNPRLVVLEQADGLFELECYSGGGCNRGNAGDAWASSSAGFDDATTPNGRLYGGATGAYVTNISASGPTMTAILGPGTSAVFRVTSAGDVLGDGDFYGADFRPGAADVAEWVSVTGSAEPGAVLELDPERPGAYRPSQGACSMLVGGVVSSQPGMTLGQTTPAANKALLALIGIVPVKVTNEGGPIQPGDLLVSSSTPGYAMRWSGPDPCPCVLVGKALQPFTGSRGLILVLLTAH